MKRIFQVSLVVVLLLMAVMALSACGSDPDYYIFDVRYNPTEKMITWGDNSPAESWLVSINNGENDKVKTHSYEYDAQDQTFDVRIEGLYKDKGHELNPVARVTVTYLPPAKNLQVKDGFLTWDSVPGATSYVVNNNGYTNNVTNCSYQIPAGAFNISVSPVTTGVYYTYPSEKISGTIMATPTNLGYSNGAFTWDAVSGADYYEVVINGSIHETTTNSFTYERNKTDIEISVFACSRQEGAYKSAPLIKICYYLKPISTTSYQFDAEGNLTWAPVENATSYDISLNGQNVVSVTEPKYTGLQLDTRYTITVTPKAEFSYTDTPAEYTFEKLSPVTGVKFAEGKITWDAHPRAVSYELKVNGETYNVTANSYDMSGIKATLTIEVYAKGDIENARSYTASQEVYTYLPVVTNINVVDGVLVWSASEGAARYDLQFLDGSVSSEVAQYTNITPNRQYVVKIIPRGNEKSYSYWSGEFTFTVLAAPEVAYDQGVFYWQGNNDANGYTVRITNNEGEIIKEDTLGKTTTRYKYDFTTPGKYAVSVKTNAPAGGNIYGSVYSPVKNVTKLADVTTHELINTNASTDNVQISVSAVEGATYKVFVNGTEYSNSNTNTFSLDLLSLAVADKETTFTIGVQAMGSVTADHIILDSSRKYEFNLIRLATPQNVKISGGTVTWDNVNNAAKYIVSVDGTPVECGTSNHTLTNLQPGPHKITVQAINRDSKLYVSSCHTAPMNVTKLQTPADVKINSQGSEVAVTWSQVEGSQAYSIQVGTSVFDATRTGFNITKYAAGLEEGSGLQISVYAKGNGSNIIDSEPSKVMTIAKLRAPEGLGVNGDNITWTPSSIDGINAESYELTISGGGMETQVHPVSGTQFSVSNLPAGTFNITVKAIGNNTSTLTSGNSGMVTVTKLAAVSNVKMEVGTHVITWDAVQGATDYLVNVNGQDYTVTQPSFDVADKFTSSGTYSVSIRAISASPNVIAGDMAKIDQRVEAMQTPTFVSGEDALAPYKFTYRIEGENIVITVAQIEGMPVTYKFIVDGIEYTGSDAPNVYRYHMADPIPGLPYVVRVQLMVNCFSGDGIYYINSNPSADCQVYYENA